MSDSSNVTIPSWLFKLILTILYAAGAYYVSTVSSNVDDLKVDLKVDLEDTKADFNKELDRSISDFNLRHEQLTTLVKENTVKVNANALTNATLLATLTAMKESLTNIEKQVSQLSQMNRE